MKSPQMTKLKHHHLLLLRPTWPDVFYESEKIFDQYFLTYTRMFKVENP